MRRSFVPRKRALVLALVLAFGGSAFAASLEQLGAADSAPAGLQTYGVDVPVKTGLKSLLPEGWQIFVHRSAQLPETISWGVDQTWPQAFEAIAHKHALSVLVDWNERAVYVRSPEVALEEGAKRAEIAQAATTPLPAAQAPQRTPLPVLTASAPASLPSDEQAPSLLSSAVAQSVVPVAANVDSAPSEAVSSDDVSVLPAARAPAAAPVHAPAVEAVPSAVATHNLAAETPVREAQAEPSAPPPALTRADTSLSATTSSQDLARAQRMAEARAAAQAAGVVADGSEKHASTAMQPLMRPAPARERVQLAAPTFTPVAIHPDLTRQAVASAATGQTVSMSSDRLASQARLSDSANTEERVAAPTSLVANVAGGPATSEAAVAPSVSSSASAQSEGASSFHRKAVGDVLEHAARTHGYLVSFEAPEAHFPGPVTLMGTDMGEELRLMTRALGPATPVRFELYRESRVVRVLPAASSLPALTVAPHLYTGPLLARTPAPVVASAARVLAPENVDIAATTQGVPVVALAPLPVETPPAPAADPISVRPTLAAEPTESSSAAPHLAPEPVRRDAPEGVTRLEPPSLAHAEPAPDESAMPSIPAPVSVVFAMREGESLRDALEAFLKGEGLQLKWTLKEDLQASWPVSLEGSSVAAILHALMPKLGLSADIYTPSSLVVVRAADAALDK